MVQRPGAARRRVEAGARRTCDHGHAAVQLLQVRVGPAAKARGRKQEGAALSVHGRSIVWAARRLGAQQRGRPLAARTCSRRGVLGTPRGCSARSWAAGRGEPGTACAKRAGGAQTDLSTAPALASSSSALPAVWLGRHLQHAVRAERTARGRCAWHTRKCSLMTGGGTTAGTERVSRGARRPRRERQSRQQQAGRSMQPGAGRLPTDAAGSPPQCTTKSRLSTCAARRYTWKRPKPLRAPQNNVGASAARAGAGTCGQQQRRQHPPATLLLTSWRS